MSDLSEHHALVEAQRQRLGAWRADPDAPRYSVCVCNYNMADTLERAMGSVCEQLNEMYEVVDIDDGSSDGSLEILEMLQQKYDIFRYIPLPRDHKRRLGETRNISIRAARGEYVLLHIDADDEWEPFLQDLVTLYHKIEDVLEQDYHLSGQQTGIGKRDVLLRYGPYENIYRCEDRNLMMKLAKDNILWFLDYRVYRTRMSRPPKKKFIKILNDACAQMMYEMRMNEPRFREIGKILAAPFRDGVFSLRIRILRALLVLPCYIISRFQRPIKNAITWQELRDYQAAHRGTYAELMARLGGDPDISFLSKDSQYIYSYGYKHEGFKSFR